MCINLERLDKYREGYNYAIGMMGVNGNELGRHREAQRFGAWFMRSDWDDMRVAWGGWCAIPFTERMGIR